jgi:hypothetical protein
VSSFIYRDDDEENNPDIDLDSEAQEVSIESVLIQDEEPAP